MRKTFALITAALGILILFASAQTPAYAAGPPKFLTLPFENPKKIAIQRAWTTFNPDTGNFDLNHHAIDYVFGKRDQVPTWKKFDTMAAAEGEACGAKASQGGCFDSGEIMGNRVLIKHKVEGETFYTFYNHLDSIAKNIPLNDIKDTVHVNAGDVIGVVGESNSPGVIHLHWELLDKNFKPLDPYGIYGITDQYPDPAGKNGRKAKNKNYFLTNPPIAFGVEAPTPTPGPTDEPQPTGAGESPGASLPIESLDPGATQVPGATGGSGASPGASQVAVTGTPAPGSSGSVSAPSDGGGLGIVPIAVAIGAVVAAVVLLGLMMLSRRRNQNLPRDNWRP